MGKIRFLPISVVSALVARQVGKRSLGLTWKVFDDQEAPKGHRIV
jgi:hypothetical protein